MKNRCEMYQLTKTINDELVFSSRNVGSIQAAEYMLKSMATQEEFIGEVSKSGQLVEIENRVVIWTPGEKWVRYIDGKLNIIELKIKTVES